MPERICALLFRRVGDSLLATPALRAIKQRFPQAYLQVLAEPQAARVFHLNPWIDETRVVRRVDALGLARKLRSDGAPSIVLDFLSDPRSALASYLSYSPVRAGFATKLRQLLYTHRVPLQDERNPVYSAQHKLGLATAVGALGSDDKLDFFLTDSDRKWVTALWQERGWLETVPTAAFFIHSRREHKRWPIRHFAEVIRHVRGVMNWRPLILQTPGDEAAVSGLLQTGIVTESNVVEIADLGHLGAVLKKCAMLIGNDGGPKHIAVALDVPTLTIFMTDKPGYWTPPHSLIHGAVESANNAAPVHEVIRRLELHAAAIVT